MVQAVLRTGVGVHMVIVEGRSGSSVGFVHRVFHQGSVIGLSGIRKSCCGREVIMQSRIVEKSASSLGMWFAGRSLAIQITITTGRGLIRGRMSLMGHSDG